MVAEKSPTSTTTETGDIFCVSLDKDSFPIDEVTVYFDRAEIKRRVSWQPSSTGLLELSIPRLGNSVLRDSVRVMAHGGDLVIKEVSLTMDPMVRKEKWKDNKEATALINQLEILADSKQVLISDIQQLETNKQLFLEFSRTMLTKVPDSAGDSKSSSQLPLVLQLEESSEIPNLIVGASRFLWKYREQMNNMNHEINRKQKEVIKLVNDIKVTLEKLRSLTGIPFIESKGTIVEQVNEYSTNIFGQIKHSEVSACARILLQVKSAGSLIELDVTYQVTSASWSPSYDLRLTVYESSKPSIQLQYFGSISQSTNENWENVKITLATAQPSFSGSPPPLPGLIARFPIPPPPPVPAPVMLHRNMIRKKKFGPMMASAEMAERDSAEETALFGSVAGGAMFQTTTAESMGSHASFVIPTKHTVNSDGQQHKVTIGIITCKADLSCFSTPEVTDRVFLSASILNDSEYLLIPSKSVAVFFENSFITKTEMKRVAPGEKMTIYIGEDPQIVAESKPMQKFRKSVGGLISRAFRDTYEMKVVYRNTRNSTISLVAVFRQPRPTDDRIKVSSLIPELSKSIEISMTNDNLIFSDAKFEEVNLTGTGIANGVWFFNKETRNYILYFSLLPFEMETVTYCYQVEAPQEDAIVTTD